MQHHACYCARNLLNFIYDPEHEILNVWHHVVRITGYEKTQCIYVKASRLKSLQRSIEHEIRVTNKDMEPLPNVKKMCSKQLRKSSNYHKQAIDWIFASDSRLTSFYTVKLYNKFNGFANRFRMINCQPSRLKLKRPSTDYCLRIRYFVWGR